MAKILHSSFANISLTEIPIFKTRSVFLRNYVTRRLELD